MSDGAFDRLRRFLPDFGHVSVDFSTAVTPEEMLNRTEQAAKDSLSFCSGPLLIGGWSLGGLLALRLGAKGLADGLVLLSATARFIRPRGQSDLGWADVYVRQMIAGLRKERQAVEDHFRQMVFTEEELADGLRENLPLIGGWTTPALIAGLQVLRDVECLSGLPEISCPALLVHGTEDSICPYAAAEEMLAQLPRATLIPLPGSGHAPFLGKEIYLAESLRRWWNEQQKNSAKTSI